MTDNDSSPKPNERKGEALAPDEEIRDSEVLPRASPEGRAAEEDPHMSDPVSTTADVSDEARPRAGAEAARVLARRLRALLTGSIHIDRYQFHSPFSEAVGDHVVVRFRATDLDGPGLTLYVAPRQHREVDLRGELRLEDGAVVRHFDWQIIPLAELIALKEASFARWFGVPVAAERKLSPLMKEALVALRAEEDARPWEPHSWPGVHESTKDALIARDLVVALENKHGGFPHYKLTPAGRARVADLERSARPELPPPGTTEAPAHAEVDMPDEKPAPQASSPRPTSPPAARSALPWTDRVVHFFNRETGPRLTLQRTRAHGAVFGVFAEDRPDLPLASIDVIGDEIEDIRWMHAPLRGTQRDTVKARLQRALDAVTQEEGHAEPESPLGDLITMMRNRGLTALGVDPATSQDLARPDGYRPLAEALRDLAEPSGITPAEMQGYLERMGLMAAADVASQATGSDPSPLREFEPRLWDAIDDDLPLAPVLGTAPIFEVPPDCLFFRAGNRATLLVASGRPRRLRPVEVLVLTAQEDDDTVRVQETSGNLGPKDRLHRNDRSQADLTELYAQVDEFVSTLTRAPQMLEDVRRLLFWTAAMLDAPRCQGDLKASTYRSFQVAQTYYNTARQRLLEGRTGDAVRQMHEALRRISTSAAELAMSCAEGQLATVAPVPQDVVHADDVAAFARTQSTES